MRGIHGAAAVAFLFSIPALAQAPAAPSTWSTAFDAGFRFYGWNNTLGGNGTQFHVPFGVQLNGRPEPEWKVSLLLRSGAIWSTQSTATASSAVSTLTDTNVTPSLTYLGWNGFSPFASVAFNLPTAAKASNSNTTQSNGKTDPDVVATPAFGEGFNVGPTIGTNINIAPSLVLGVGAGFTYCGPFNQATSTTLSFFDPGDVYTINTSLAYRGEALSLQASAAYSLETTTTQDGAALYRAGNRLILGLRGAYTWDDNWGTKASVNYSHFDNNNVVATGIPDLVREAFNSNSDVVKLSLEVPYTGGNYTIGPTIGFLYRDRNGYDPTTFQFVPAKTNWNVGMAGGVTVARNVTLNLSLQYVWANENGSPTKIDSTNTLMPNSAVPDSTTRAWLASLGTSVKF